MAVRDTGWSENFESPINALIDGEATEVAKTVLDVQAMVKSDLEGKALPENLMKAASLVVHAKIDTKHLFNPISTRPVRHWYPFLAHAGNSCELAIDDTSDDQCVR